MASLFAPIYLILTLTTTSSIHFFLDTVQGSLSTSHRGGNLSIIISPCWLVLRLQSTSPPTRAGL